MAIFFICSSYLSGQESYRFGFYNVENLFHPEIDSINRDTDFSPEGRYHWDVSGYYKRIHRLGKVIVNMADSNGLPPVLMGLAEIESAQVLSDLLEISPLYKLKYQYVHYDSPDRRGIDVGIIYRKDLLRLINSKIITYHNPQDKNYKSRDMLYALFELPSGDSLHFVICHWPSRYGGKKASEPRRMAAARILGSFCDSIAQKSESPIILMGDFNDGPTNQSLLYLSDSLKSRPFLNLMKNLDQSLGSHRYQGEWAYLDQILISNRDSQRVVQSAVFKAPSLLEEDSRYPGVRPKRAFKGTFFGSGFSDHLPVFVDYQRVTQP